MEDICRLCCSKNFVNNRIFDEENALYLKMSLYLPIKVFKNDRLPQKICDKCSCRVNDFYQFCNETIEVQHRLRALLAPLDENEIVDLTRIKQSGSPVPDHNTQTRSTQTETYVPSGSNEGPPPVCQTYVPSSSNDDPSPECPIPVKQEPRTLSPVKEELYEACFEGFSDNSDDVSLISLKKKKKTKKTVINGVEKRGRKKKPKLPRLEMLMNTLPKGTKLSVLNSEDIERVVKQEASEENIPALDVTLDVKKVKDEVDSEAIHCCVCMMQCYSKREMIRHYKQHALESPPAPPPPPPPLPELEPARCARCKKCVSASEWGAHWARHWRLDARPYRCALCERSFRKPELIYKHGLTHQNESGEQETRDKRFICDLCPEGFFYMRYLQSHRVRAHPEACTRALALRCGVCARTFAHTNSLRRHVRAHSGERNHLCNVCGKALSSREHLKFHIRIHTGYKPNVCKTCGKGFVKKCNLTLHERVHSGEKPHVCAHCGKAFSQRSTLVIHERYHSGARPYVCALCGRGFVAKGLLSVHLKTTCI